MCGIIGVTIRPPCGDNAVPLAVEGLRRLEYRGYDSAGVALVKCSPHGCSIEVYKAKGEVDEVVKRYSILSKSSPTVIAHTRWATHGPPSDVNAHPHTDCSGVLALVHNGIIKNYLRLKERLLARGHVFKSETDTEVLAHILEEEVKSGATLLEALRRMLEIVEGSIAIAVVYAREPNRIYFARRESPLYVVLTECVAAVSSDIPSLLHISNRVIPVEDDEYGYIEPGRLELYSLRKGRLEWSTRVKHITWSVEEATKGGYKHYMLKEIFEQPRALYETLSGIIEDPMLEKAAALLASSNRIYVTGAGTSYHAGLVFKHFMIKWARRPVIDYIASEHWEYDNVIGDGDVVIAVSQSGETIDTLQAVRVARKKGAKVIGVTNVIGSTLSRIADLTLYTRAGPEIGVAATKTYLTQVLVLQVLAATYAARQGIISRSEYEAIISSLWGARDAAKSVEKYSSSVESLARLIVRRRSMYVLGRGLGALLAREAALKIKEIAYIHAEAYPAGESKHGPIALVEEGFPVIFIGTPGYEKRLSSNIEEMKARGAMTIIVGVDSYEEAPADYRILVGSYDEIVSTYAIMPLLQLLAYDAAVLLGYDPDKPRNLAKTVTVEEGFGEDNANNNRSNG